MSLLIIIQSCKTVPCNDIHIPPQPERTSLNVPKTEEEYVDVIIYYETLLQKWELWAQTVEKIIQNGSEKK
jgi:hypothetical protein